MPILAILVGIGNILAPIIAGMGYRLLSERVVRRVTVITLRKLAESSKNKFTHDMIATVADALDVPPTVYKAEK